MPFAFDNKSIHRMAHQLSRKRNGKSSVGTLGLYILRIKEYSVHIGENPDQMIAKCKQPDGTTNYNQIERYRQQLDDMVALAQEDNLSPSTCASYTRGVQALFNNNGFTFVPLFKVKTQVVNKDRPPTKQELIDMIAAGTLKEKVIVTALATAGLRLGTLAVLTYGHIREDLEAGKDTIHIHVKADETKGEYHDYDTFLGKECVQFIKLYLAQRRVGTRKLQPEELTDSSPLIRSWRNTRTAWNKCTPRFLTEDQLGQIVRDLYYKTKLGKKIQGNGSRKRNKVRPHSIRKFFRTQCSLAMANVVGEFTGKELIKDATNYMMGHSPDTYEHIQMQGVEWLRHLYVSSGFSIETKAQLDKLDILRGMIRSLGLNPDDVLNKGISAHATAVNLQDQESLLYAELVKGIKGQLREEFRNGR